MKVSLKPGAELDVLTQDELEDSLAAALSGFSRPPQTEEDFATFTLDSSGNSVLTGSATNVAVAVYTVQVGYDFSLHRLTVEAATATTAYTVAAPYTNGSGGIAIYRNGRFVDGLNLASGLPMVFTYGGDAPIFRSRDRVELLVIGGPANGFVTVNVQGTLESGTPALVTT